MGIQCLKCGHIESGAKGLHLFSKCPECGNTDRNKIIRVDDKDEDINPKKHKEDQDWLESHKAGQNE